MNVIEHKVSSVDTVQSLAALYYGDASQWRDIVDFNNLDYPYITSDPSFQNYAYSSGALLVVRPYTSAALTVPKGTLFGVPEVEGFPSRIYASVSDVTLPIGVGSTLIPIQCTAPGLWGDVTQNSVTSILTSDPSLSGAFTTITNTSPLSNGNTFNVKLMGDSVLIPVDDSYVGTVTYSDINAFYEAQFGQDLALGQDGDLIFDGYGNIGSVSGIYNLAQAARDRMITPKLSLVYHPEYGQIAEQLIPRPGVPYAKKMIALAIMETLIADDRIDHVNVVSLDQIGTNLNIVVDVYPIQQGDALRVPFELPNLSIM